MPHISKSTWWHIFRPESGSQHPGGLDALTRGTTARIFDDFESYASDVAIAAVWSGTNVTVTRSTAANALKGGRSMNVVVAGGTGNVNRSINNNLFGQPVGSSSGLGRLRYIAFKIIADSGSQTTDVRIGDASDANLYREWRFTVAQDKTRDFVIDIYSGSTTALGGGGYLNTESYPGPNAEGATAWDSSLVDQISFRNLTTGRTYRIDDIRFYYEYSLMDAVGFGTEPVTDDGADGSLHSKLRYINNIVLQLIGTTEQYAKYGPSEVRLNNSYTWGLELKGMAEQGIPSTTEITPGNYTIDRVRNGTTTNIVASTGATEAAGFISATYTPLEDNWQLGDEIVVTFSGGRIDADTDTAVTPTSNIGLGATTIQLANAALFQAGQRIRIYDDLTTEWNAVVSVDSPVQITVTATANAYTAANNFRVIFAVRTELQTARFAGNVTHQPEITAELERWVLADYDDFDFADADGNNERWDVGYIANSDGSAAGAEGGTADINTTTAGQARVAVDPDATPTQSAYALKRDEVLRSRYYSVMVDADVALNAAQATSTFGGLRISAGDVDDAANYVLIAREASTTVNRITARAEFAGGVQTTVNFATTDNAVAFKIERYGNVWNVFYSLTQYPNWIWTKLTQFEDANGDMTSSTSCYLYSESGGSADAQTSLNDFDNWKYYIGSGSIDQLLSTSVLASGTFTTSSTTVPADTGRTEENNYWNGTILMPTTGVVAFQPRIIVSFANAGGVFTIDPEAVYTTAPAVGDEYVILAYQYPLEPATDSTSNSASAHVVGSKADTASYARNSTNSLMRYLKGLHTVEIIATGTFTTSSATVPADTGRAEANDYWNGSWLIPLTGDVALQPRLIVDFANAGGVFTIDAQQPFTAATGLVTYVIVSPNSQLVPAADAATNTTPAHVIGNKSDVAAVAAGTASIIARLRAIEAALSVNAAAGGEFELDGDPDLWDALVNNSSADASITTTTGNRDASIIQRLAAIINAHGVTDAGTATGFEEDGTGGTLWESLVAVKGTFTTSSATVPADTGRTEANDYFNGDLIIPLSGAVVGQARVIADFANAGGVFTLDSELPFTAVPGLVTYIIIHYKYPLVPAADSAANTTSAHVVGNKTDAIPAMNAAPGNDSIVAHTKAILERLGATPADPDDSVLTNIGQRDDVSTAADSTDVTTTSIQAKLRAILNRVGENTADNIYDSSTVTSNRDGSILERLENVIVALGTDGTTPVDSATTLQGSIGINDADNAFDSSAVVANINGSVLERLEAISSGLVVGTGTFTTSSTTVPADTGRLEATDYYKGCLLIPLTGAVAFQPRLITSFTTATGVFTLDAEEPFTAAPGLVTYIIVSAEAALTPAANSASNTTAAHTTGNKTDSIPAMNAAPGNDSIVAHLKAILERVGATPADPDDSLLTTVGQRDDAVTVAATASVISLLRDLIAGLGVVAAGAGGGFEIDGAPSLVTALGTTGSVVSDSATSVLGAIGADNADNAFASTLVAANRDGSVLERLEDIRAEVDDTPKVYDVIIYPVAEDIGTTVLADDGSSPAYMPAAAASTTAGVGAPATAWSEDINFEQEGTLTVISIYLEAEWQTRFLLNAGTGTNTASQFQISRDGGASWVNVTDVFTHSTATMTNRLRAGVGNWITSIVAGANQLQFRLLHWVVASDGVSASEAQIRSNSYARLTIRKS